MAKTKSTEVRKVIVATPALTGQVSAWYLDSLVQSVKLCANNGIEIFPITLINESILHMARNELVTLAYESDVESMVFIDSDQGWNPQALLKVINSADKDVLGVAVVDKTDEYGRFNVKVTADDCSAFEKSDNSLIRVNTVGTGFLKLSKKAINALCESSQSVTFRGKTLKKVFDFGSIDLGEALEDFIGEDINLCRKLKSLGFDIWVDTEFTCSHVGSKVWHGDYGSFLREKLIGG